MNRKLPSTAIITKFVTDNKKIILKWVKFIIIFGLFGALFVKFPVDKLKVILLGINIGYAIIGVTLGYVSSFFYTLFMWIVAREKQIRITLIKLFGINLGIKFYSLFSPTSLVGSGIRLYRLAENSNVEDALSAITFSRFVDIVITLIDGVIWMFISFYTDQINIWWIGGFIILLIILWLFFTMISTTLINILNRIITAEKVHIYIKRILQFIKKYVVSLSELKSFKLKKILLLIIIDVTYDFINTTTYYLFTRALNIQLGFATLGWMRSIIAISSLIPLNTIGGLGVREISTYTLMIANGVSAELAIAFSMVNYLRISLVSFSGGIIELIETVKTKVQYLI